MTGAMTSDLTTAHRLGAAADDWRIDTLDLDAYLERTGQSRAAPSAAALRELQAAHVRAIAFENIDSATGKVPSLDLPSIADKIVRRGRGGYCYEHGLLFAAVLERLGYEVTRLAARVQQPGPREPKTHQLLMVRVAGETFHVDVGFGRGILYPMPLADGAVVDQGGWPHRLVADGESWWLEKQTQQGWSPQYVFDTTPQYLADYQVSNHYTATRDDSPFTGQLVVMRLDHGIAWRLVRDTLTVEYPDGRVEKSTITDLGATLRELGVELPAEELADLQARYGPAAEPTATETGDGDRVPS